MPGDVVTAGVWDGSVVDIAYDGQRGMVPDFIVWTAGAVVVGWCALGWLTFGFLFFTRGAVGWPTGFLFLVGGFAFFATL